MGRAAILQRPAANVVQLRVRIALRRRVPAARALEVVAMRRTREPRASGYAPPCCAPPGSSGPCWPLCQYRTCRSARVGG
eukprot:3941198-Rhodomonas_salina.5